MTIAITEDHKALADTARALLARQGGTSPARLATDGEPGALPSAYTEWAELGWLGLAAPESLGGQGYGLTEMAIVLFELGRVVAPGPFLPTVWAVSTLLRHGGEELCQRLVPELVSGRRTAGVGMSADTVMSGSPSDVVLVADGGDVVVYDLHGSRTEMLDSFDRTRPLARLVAGATPLVTLHGAATDMLAIGRALASAEVAGAASACLEQATAYAKEREQFGRVIGSFQAVKHHLANMLVMSELATATAWDAAQAAQLDTSTTGADDQLALAAAAAAYGLTAAVAVAKLHIQVSGGVGYTWVHDAHLFLRRVTALRSLLASDPDPAEQLVDLTRRGVRRFEAVELPPEAEAFRAAALEAREQVLAMPESERRAGLAASGYLVPHWPEPWGRGASAIEQLVIDEVFADVDRPDLSIHGWVTLTIAQHGTPDQLERFIAPGLRGELLFCQMFSEPGAGSDAAAIRTRGARTDGGWIVNGQKVWTSTAHVADRGFATVRTDSSGSKHEGVTMMVIDLTSPGVDIRPLRQITGESHFNEVFFTDVFVPDDDVIGPVGDGWRVARATLGNERVSIGSVGGYGTPATELACRVPADGGWDRELGGLIAEQLAQRALQRRLAVKAVAGAAPGAEGNVTKLASGELSQRVSDLALRMAGPAGVAGEDHAVNPAPAYEYLLARSLTIAGGTSEIVRNQIAERLLGLPREPMLT